MFSGAGLDGSRGIGPTKGGQRLMSSAWERYLRWNTALCETVFTEERAGQPVYLDMDDEVLANVSSRLSMSPERAATELTAAVRATLKLAGGQADVFRTHLQQLSQWRRAVNQSADPSARLKPPPTIALLAVFTLAAEAMGSDASYAVHAYYPRLSSVLGVSREKERGRLQLAYQSEAEKLWRGLNDWLTLADGRYGVPTAYALTHRYIGLPLSQALIRAADRRHLTRMFRQFGLPPGSDLPPADMARMLDTWIQQVPCPASKNLQGLWRRESARERIAEVAATELLNWDNTLADETGMSAGKKAGDVNLFAQLQRFPRPAIQLSFLATMPGGSQPEELRILSADGTPSLDVFPLAGGSVRPRSAADIDAKSMAEGVLHIADPRTGIEAKRYPRRVIPLRRDQQANAFVECERVQLGEDFLLLVKDDGSLCDKVSQILEQVARPGFRTRNAMPGLPAGWVLVTDLQILATPASQPQHPDLNALVPLISSQLNIAGGLKLPGNLRKWSSLCPPEIRAVSQLDSKLTLTLTRAQIDSGDEGAVREWRSSSGLLLVDLAEQELEDGDYELKLDGEGRALQRSILRLRSSDSPDRWSWETAPRLQYDVQTDLGALTASRIDEGAGEVAIRGAASPQSERAPGAAELRDIGPVWWTARDRIKRETVPVVIASPDPKSCVVTGAHRIMLPPALGRPTAPMTAGTCTQCGLVKRYPTWPRRSKKKAEWYDVDVDQRGRLKNVAEAEARSITRDDALDGLVHLGGGPASSLERVATQVDSSALATHSFRHGLEALGHVDIARDEQFEIKSWAMAPPCLAEANDGTFFLSGAWSNAARTRLEIAVDEAGGKLSYDENPAHGPTSWFVEKLTSKELEAIVADSSIQNVLPTETTPSVVSRAAIALVKALPPLGVIAGAVPRVPLPGARRIERFDLASASWKPVHTAASPGAYRLESAFRTLYVFRSEIDVERHEAAIGSAQLVKHVEALRMGKPLVAYYPRRKFLAAPLGADLPGLYGRAAVLNSGLLPGRAKQNPSLLYHDVSEACAARLFDLLAR